MIEIRVGVVVIEDNKILLVKHTRNSKSYWVLPGGKPRQIETLQECGKREVEEETSLIVEVTDLLFTGETYWPDGKRHIVNFFFRGIPQSGTVKKPRWSFPDEKMDVPVFVPLEELKTLKLYPDISDTLLDIASGKITNQLFLGDLWVEHE